MTSRLNFIKAFQAWRLGNVNEHFAKIYLHGRQMKDDKVAERIIGHRGVLEYLSIFSIGAVLSFLVFGVFGILFGLTKTSLALSGMVLAYTVFRMIDQWRTVRLVRQAIESQVSDYMKQGATHERAQELAEASLKLTEEVMKIEDPVGDKRPESINFVRALRQLQYRPIHMQKMQNVGPTQPLGLDDNPNATPIDQLDPAFRQFIEGFQAYAWHDDDSVLGILASGSKAHLKAYVGEMGTLSSSRHGQYRLSFDYLSPPGLGSEFHLNACAGRVEDTLCIAADCMLIPRFLELAGSFLCLPEAFAHIGDPSLEISIQRPSLNFPGFQDAVEKEIQWVSQCSIRRQFSIELTLVMLLFAWQHELSHTLEGHVDFVREYAHLEKLWERHYGEQMPIFRHAEHHADEISSSEILYLLVKNDDYLGQYFNRSIFNDLSKSQRIEAALVGLLLLFVFWDTAEMILVGQSSKRDHSSVPLRVHYLQIKLKKLFKNSLDEAGFDGYWKTAERMLSAYAVQFDRPDIDPYRGWNIQNVGNDLSSLFLPMNQFSQDLLDYRFNPIDLNKEKQPA